MKKYLLLINHVYLFFGTTVYVGVLWALHYFWYPSWEVITVDTVQDHFIMPTSAATVFFTYVVSAMFLASIVMIVTTLLLQWRPEALVSFFTDDVEVIAVGAVFLQLISWNFVAQGIVFTCSGAFQGLGNTRPALLSSASRLIVFIPISVYLKYQPDFSIDQVWYVSILSVTTQAIVSYLLVRREFAIKLGNSKAMPVTNLNA